MIENQFQKNLSSIIRINMLAYGIVTGLVCFFR